MKQDNSFEQFLITCSGKSLEKLFRVPIWTKVFFGIFSSLVHYFSFTLHRIIPWNNHYVLVEVKLTEKVFGVQICSRRAKIRSEIVLYAIFSSLVHQFSFKLHRVIVQNNVQRLVEVKLRKKNQGPKFGANGPKLGPKIRFLGIFSSLAHQLSFKLHSIIAWNSVQHYQSYNSLKMLVG